MPASTNKKVSNSHIHDDIAFSILSKLPLKSLKRFTCVKKSWFLLFQNPIFMNMFRNDFFISKHDKDDISTCLLFKERTINFQYHDTLYTHSGEKFEDKVRLEWPPPFNLDDSFIEILGCTSVKGVLCTYQKIGNDTTTVLWNPATGEFKIIPPSLQPYDNIECNSLPVAFGYDNVRDDYKVIRNARYPIEFEGNWVYVHKKESSFRKLDLMMDEGQQVEMCDPDWEIYSLRNNSWRKLDGVDMPPPWPCSSLVNLNEWCHWFGFESEMLSFDFSNEKFFATALPSDSDEMYEWILLILNDSVASICIYDDMNSFHIWILGELGVKESWTKLFIVGPLTCVSRPIRAAKKNDIFFVKKNGDLARFNLRTQIFAVIGVSVLYVHQIVTYKENFLSIEGMNN